MFCFLQTLKLWGHHMGWKILSVVAFPCFGSGKFNRAIGNISEIGIGIGYTYNSTWQWNLSFPVFVGTDFAEEARLHFIKSLFNRTLLSSFSELLRKIHAFSGSLLRKMCAFLFTFFIPMLDHGVWFVSCVPWYIILALNAEHNLTVWWGCLQGWWLQVCISWW